MSAVIPMPAYEIVRAVLGNTYDPDKTLNGAIMLAGTGDLAMPAIALMQAVFNASGTDAGMREVMILRTAKQVGCPYALKAATKIAANIGLAQATIDALLADGPVAGIDPDHALLSNCADELATAATLTDATLIALVKRWGNDQARKLTLMLGWFNLINRFENACRVQGDTDEKLASQTGPTA